MKSLHQREGITGSDALKKEVRGWREQVRLWRKEEWWECYEVWQQHEDAGPAELIHEDLRWRQSVCKLPILIQWKEKNWTWQISAGCNSYLCADSQTDSQTDKWVCPCIPAFCTSDHDSVQGLQPEVPLMDSQSSIGGAAVNRDISLLCDQIRASCPIFTS